MNSNPIPSKQDLAQDLRRIASTLTDDAQNAALRKCKELGFDTNKGIISLEETLINLSAARDILVDAVEEGKLVQLPLRLQYSLYDQTQRIAQQVTSLVNGSDEIVNLVDSVEDITAAIWQYNLQNLSGEVLGLHNKMNQLKTQETRIRQVSREAEKFASLKESAESSLSQISEMAAAAANLKGSLQSRVDEVNGILSKVSEQGQKVAGIATQVDQHETTATQQLASTKQAAADTEVMARKARELQTEMESSRDSWRDLLGEAQELLASTQTAVAAQLSDVGTRSDELVSTTQASVSTLTSKLDAAIVEQTASLDQGRTELENRVTKLVAETSTQLTQMEAAQSARFAVQLQEFTLSTQSQQTIHEDRLASQLEESARASGKQLAEQSEAFSAQAAEWAGKAEQSTRTGEAEHKRLVANLDELEGRIRESIERATGYSLFQSFQKRQLDIAKAKRFWGYVLGGVVVLSLVASGIFIYELRYVQVYNAAFYLKLSISVPLIYAIAFCNLQYSRERRLEEEYAFKSNISVSLEPYQKLVEKLVDKTDPGELSKYTAFIIDSVTRVYTSPTGHIFETPDNQNSAEKLIKALGEFIEPVIKGLKR
jgi:hypothetical protein